MIAWPSISQMSKWLFVIIVAKIEDKKFSLSPNKKKKKKKSQIYQCSMVNIVWPLVENGSIPITNDIKAMNMMYEKK